MKIIHRVRKAVYLVAKFWLMAMPLMADGLVPFHGSLVSVNQSQDVNHPEHAFVKRWKLSDKEKGETLPFEIPLKMRNFEELKAREAKGDVITPADMAANYEPTDAEYQLVVSWLTAHGFTITNQDPHHLAVFLEGPVNRISKAMNVNFAKVTSGGKDYTSAVTDPQLPDFLSGIVYGVNGLQPHLRPHHHSVAPVPDGISENSIGGPSTYTPAQIASAYGATPLYNQGITGAGQSIAIMIDTFPAQSDLQAFWTGCNINQSMSNMTFINVSGNTPAPQTGEETLDTEWASAMAPGAKVRIYACGSLSFYGLDQGYAQLLQDVRQHPEYGIHQMTMSYGLGESYTSQAQINEDSQYFAELTAAGVTCFASSGDGASTPADGNNTNLGTIVQTQTPASDPNVTAVGGTSLNAPNGIETDEEVWNGYNNMWGSGGGLSTYFTRPSWQVGVGTGTVNQRHVPDIACDADPYHAGKIYWQGWGGQAGTSWASPTCAGFMALINQVRANANMEPVGLLNSKIYPLIGTNSFRDITVGNNKTPTSGNNYVSGVGYDCCTGIGSMQVANLAAQLSIAPQIAVTPTGTLTLPSFQAAATASTATFTISNPGQVALAVSSITYVGGGFTGSWSSGTIAAGASQVVTVSATATTVGVHTATITIADSASSSNSLLPVSVTITAAPAPAIAVTPSGMITLPSQQLTMGVPTGTFTISNTGAAPLIVSGITFPTHFAGNWTSGTIAAGGSQVVTVTATATAIGTYTGNITIASNATAASLLVSATFTPAPVPQLAFSPLALLTLPSFAATTTPSTATFTISNPGQVPLVVSGITYPTNFSGNWTSGTIAAGGSQIVTVSSTATAAGTYSGTVSVASNATGAASSLIVTVTASAAPAPQIAVSSANLILPLVEIGAVSSTGSFTISNPGQAPLVVTGITYPAHFSGNWTSGTIAAGASQTVTVSVAATVAGTYTGTISIASNVATKTVVVSSIVVTSPTIATVAVGTISGSTAVLNGTVKPTGRDTSVCFQYGITTSYGNTTTAVDEGSGTTSISFSTTISGLAGKTVYHYRAVVTTSASTTYGVDRTFSTLTPPVFGGLAVSSNDATGVKITGTVASGGSTTTTYIQYGTTTSYGNQTLGATLYGTSTVTGITGLQAGTTYYYRIVTVSAAGAYYGSTGSFTTPTMQVSALYSRGSVAPGTASTFSTFGYPVINDSDNVAFRGALTSGLTGIWAATSAGVMQLVAEQGTAAPGTSKSVNVLQAVTRTGDVYTTQQVGANFATFTDPVYNDNSEVAFSATLAAGSAVPAGTATGVWTNAGGTLNLVARLGGTTPGMTGGTFTAFNSLALPDQGGVLLMASAHTTHGTVTGLWEGTSSADLQLLAYTGEVISGKTVTAVNTLPVGEVQTRSFTQAQASLACVVTFSDSSTAILTLVGDNWNLSAQSATVAPGANNVKFSTFNTPVINSQNHMAFAAALANHASGIWTAGTNGTPVLTALTGTAAPGTTSTFTAFNDPVDNSSDVVAFMATLANRTTGIWSGPSTALNLVAVSGTQAVGCPTGVNYSTFVAVGLPDQGGVVFTATLSGMGVTSANNTALFAVDTAGKIALIMRAGDSFDGRTLASLSCLPIETAIGGTQTRSFVQDSGDLAYLVSYTDGTTALIKVVLP